MEREACVCDHGFERSDLCAEIIIIIIIITKSIPSLFCLKQNLNASRPSEHPSLRGIVCENVLVVIREPQVQKSRTDSSYWIAVGSFVPTQKYNAVPTSTWSPYKPRSRKNLNASKPSEAHSYARSKTKNTRSQIGRFRSGKIVLVPGTKAILCEIEKSTGF